jgi:hypothetical protein
MTHECPTKNRTWDPPIYEWPQRTERPKACPRCKNRLDRQEQTGQRH